MWRLCCPDLKLPLWKEVCCREDEAIPELCMAMGAVEVFTSESEPLALVATMVVESEHLYIRLIFGSMATIPN